MVAAAGQLVVKMVIAALSGMGAATFCHPLDVVRVQMQTGGGEGNEGLIGCAGRIVEQQGVLGGLYAGVGAAYLRQWLYGSCRIGIYAFLLERAQAANVAKGLDANAIPFATKLLMGCTSGGIGSLVGTPSELALVRMSNDSKLPPKQRRNYKSVFDCIGRIYKEEGLLALWTGAQATVLRAMVLSATVLSITSEIKLKLTATGRFGPDGKLFHGVPLLFVATLISSLCAIITSNPLDVVKSRTQNQSVNPKTGEPEYKSLLDCFGKLLSKEGVPGLYKGFLPSYVKLAPYNVISFLLTEKLNEVVTGKGAF